ncbi:ABC-2 type transport system ATP-binding protein [Melghiribacillus thermohalophilus]|uniref:ABC-2 type transport system ATP-binding protein n=1 Tax=Melghiribacillus thermohalophilus TaxID=1324956 RepID=A0A4R3MQ59_9BACI|nr:ABC transporter ATP-binding protein [Melghiribacillus thermohalophilus]TCT18003.1 ABC-2 type transport system ATP-binding protein [Melghiribacillus thermohalophilus]
MIYFEQVNHYYKHLHTLKDISVEIGAGESIGIIGPNGAGKSTFLKIMASVLQPREGQVYYEGEPYTACIKRLRKNLGYIPQQIALFEELSVQDQLKFWEKAAKRRPCKTFMQEMKDVLGLEQVMNQKVRELSGGWKRKVNVASGLLHDPDIILLDEPTAGMDLAAKHDLLLWLKHLHDKGKTITIISHDWSVISRLCSRVLIFQDGQLRFDGGMDELRSFQTTLSEERDQELKKILDERTV